MADLAGMFVADSRRCLTHRYLPKVESSVRQLTDEQVWARANEGSNSIGNVLLHLAGSTRYWSEQVIGGVPIGRDRQREFDERGGITAHELLERLRASVAVADARLASLTEEELLERRATNDEEVTVFWAAYHLVEHFAMHTGQVLSMTKALVGHLR